jgi:uncharacterized membrane protein
VAELLGLPIPDEGPAFLIILLVHILAGLTGVVCGAIAALSRKGGPTHVRFGRIYGWALVAIIATMAAMAVMRWQENWHLAPIGLVAGTALATGWLDRRRKAEGHDRVHIVAMGCSYVALLTGFYVDNGPHLRYGRTCPTGYSGCYPASWGCRSSGLLCAVDQHRTLRRLDPKHSSATRTSGHLPGQVSTTRCYSTFGAPLPVFTDKSRQQHSGYRSQARTMMPRLTTHPQSAHPISMLRSYQVRPPALLAFTTRTTQRSTSLKKPPRHPKSVDTPHTDRTHVIARARIAGVPSFTHLWVPLTARTRGS